MWLTCDEADSDKLIDQQDREARSKRRKLETANTLATVDESLASFKPDFCNALKQVEQTDRKSKLEVQEAIKQYSEIVKESADLVAALSPTQVWALNVCFQHWGSSGRTKGLQWRRNTQKPSCSWEQTIKCTLKS